MISPPSVPGLKELSAALNAPGAVASTACFLVTLDFIPLGAFSSADGLGVEVECEKVKVGGQNDHDLALPTRLRYPNVRLRRPLTWQVQLTQAYFRFFTKHRHKGTAVIEAHHNDGSVIGSWSLSGVVPVKWNGPSFSMVVGTSAIAYEELEIAHDGFLSNGIASALAGL
jgi:phage tail-like protein